MIARGVVVAARRVTPTARCIVATARCVVATAGCVVATAGWVTPTARCVVATARWGFSCRALWVVSVLCVTLLMALQKLLCSTHAQSVLMHGFIHNELTAAFDFLLFLLVSKQFM